MSALNALIVCGPSGVGKGTLLKRLFADYGSRFAYSVSHTTRQPRAGEVDGREYHFTTREEVLKMQENNGFLELCDVHGNFYGTSVAAVQAVKDQGKVCVLEIDVKGAQKLMARTDAGLKFAAMFITAPPEELRKRIAGRGSDDAEMIEKRLKTAESEFAFLKEHPEFFFSVIVNGELEEAYTKLVGAISAEFEKHGMEPLRK